MDLPQPVIWWEEDGEQAAVAVQAESHLGLTARRWKSWG